MTTGVRSIARQVTIAAVCLLGQFAVATAANMNITPASVRLGSLVAGSQVSADMLQQRVVLLQFWGVECPVCTQWLPKLEELAQELGPQGLVVISAHHQAGSIDDIRRKAADLGITFPVFDKATIKDGMDFEALPHAVLFDHTGRCIYRGAPGELQEALVAAVKAAPASVFEGRVFKKIAAFNIPVKGEQQYGQTLRRAKGMLDAKDETTVEEATYVVEKLEARGRGMLDDAKTKRESDPVTALDLLQRCSAGFKGTELGTEATGLLKDWKKDAEFQTVLKAGQQAAQLESLRTQVMAAFGELPTGQVTDAMLGGIPPNVKAKMQDLARAIRSGHPGSEMASRAGEIAREFGLDVGR